MQWQRQSPKYVRLCVEKLECRQLFAGLDIYVTSNENLADFSLADAARLDDHLIRYVDVPSTDWPENYAALSSLSAGQLAMQAADLWENSSILWGDEAERYKCSLIDAELETLLNQLGHHPE